MSFLSAAWTAWQVGQEHLTAGKAFQAALESGKGPLVALDAFAALTKEQLDDTLVAELRQGIQQLVHAAAQISTGAATVAQVLDDPRIPATIERLHGVVVDGAYQLGRWRHILEAWLETS